MERAPSDDIKYMRMAIALARRGEGKVRANPMVGCVIVKNSRVVSRGYHKFFGGPHAEAVAIEKLVNTASGRRKLSDSALYVNLEPCRHTNKKTPPCVPLIIKSGIKKVVAGMKDPNPSVAGKGLTDLKRSGVETSCGALESECRELNKVYIKNISRQMPYVTVKAAMTLDGKIASGDGDSKWISSEVSRAAVHLIRASSDAVLVGAGTVVKDNPMLTARVEGRRRLSSVKNPTRVAVDPSGIIPLNSRIFDGAARTIVVTTASRAGRFARMRSPMAVPDIITLEKTSGGEFDFKEIMKELFARGITSVLAEGGGKTNWSIIKSGAADEYIFFVAPKILGGRSAKTPVEGEGFGSISSSLKLKIKDIFESGGDVAIKAVPVKGRI